MIIMMKRRMYPLLRTRDAETPPDGVYAGADMFVPYNYDTRPLGWVGTERSNRRISTLGERERKKQTEAVFRPPFPYQERRRQKVT
jgi:hypothetical protein